MATRPRLHGFVLAVVAVTAMLPGSAASGQSVDRNNPQPAGLLAGCEADLTGDKRADLVLLVDTVRGVELLALVSTDVGGYSTFVLSRGRAAGILRCELGSEIRETRAGRGSGRLVRAPGAFVRLVWPESSSVAYVWDTDRFLEVRTRD